MTIASPTTQPPFAVLAPTPRTFDRHFWLAMVIATVVLLGRSWMITSAQSERIDDEYHIQRGVMFFNRTLGNQKAFKLNDPPLGEAIGVLPLWIAGNWAHHPKEGRYIWGEKYSADTILNIIGLWKSLLLVPMIGVVFVWVRKLFGTKSAWLAVGLILIEPTIAAHTPLPSLDVLGMEGIIVAAFLGWRYFEKPTIPRLIAANLMMAVALLLKHTAIILPITAVVFAVLWWEVNPWLQGNLAETWRARWRTRLAHIVIAGFTVCFSIWALLLFDYSRPFPPPREVAPFRRNYPIIGDVTKHRFPAGLYLTSVLQAEWHNERGHPGYLWGRQRSTGWWYYFPVVSTYKVPIALGVLIIVGLFSMFWFRPRWDEWSLLVPMLLLVALMLTSSINIGWRHFMPAELLMILIATRLVLIPLKPVLIGAWALSSIAWIDTLRYHPDYLSYITFPRQEGWKDISDSNVDWGQGLKYVKSWMDKNAGKLKDRKVYLSSYAWSPKTHYIKGRFGDSVTVLERDPQLPGRGVLIISTVDIMGMYEPRDWYKALRKRKPEAILGHAMLVYDLDKLRGKERSFNWGPRPSARRGAKRPARASTRPVVSRITTTQSAN